MRRLWIIGIIWVALCGCSAGASCPGANSAEPALHVLFIGNSYTYVNDLPSEFSKLACSGGHKVETGVAASGGWTLADHVGSADTQSKLSSQKWDYVVLQEQSEIPALAHYREQSMYPAARTLVSRIRAAGAQPVLFITWAHRGGLPDAGLADFGQMQAQLDAGYQGLARELNVAVAPVGDAWLNARSQPSPPDLWQDDGSHPNAQGTYLAACVLYAVIIRQRPVGLTYTAGIGSDAALRLQNLAAYTVSN